MQGLQFPVGNEAGASPVQCSNPGLEPNLAKVPAGYAMSRWVVMARYMMDPTALRYGMFFMWMHSSLLLGHMSFDNHLFGSIRIDTNLQFSMPNCWIILRVYLCWDNDMEWHAQLWSILIPNS